MKNFHIPEETKASITSVIVIKILSDSQVYITSRNNNNETKNTPATYFIGANIFMDIPIDAECIFKQTSNIDSIKWLHKTYSKERFRINF